MRDPLNIQAIAEAEPDYLGFIFYPGSSRFVGVPDRMSFHEATAGIMKVGVFVNEQPERVAEMSDSFGLDLLQMHGTESPAYCEALKLAGFRVIKTFGVDAGFDFKSLTPYLPVCDYILLDSKSDRHGGTGRKFSWDLLRQYTYKTPFFLSGGIEPEDAATIRKISHPAFYGVDINSRFEIVPGIKDADQVKSFIKAIKNQEK